MDGPLRESKALTPRYKGLPKKYEDTRPVQTQLFTHSNILDIGQNIHVNWETKTEEEKNAAIKSAKEAVWQQATHVKEIALEKCQQQAQEEQDKKVKQLNTSREKALMKQTLKVESEMKLIALEQVKKEREHGDCILQDTIKKLIAEKDLERENDVATARREDIDNATTEAEKVAKETVVKATDTAQKAAADKAMALQELSAKMEQEEVDSILNTQMDERRAAAVELGKVQKTHSNEIAKLKEEIREGEARYIEALGEVEQEKKEKEDWIRKYKALKSSYQLFINETDGFNKGQADFLI